MTWQGIGMVELSELLVEALIGQPDVASAELVERVRDADPLLPTMAVSALVGRARQRAGGLGRIDSLLEDPDVTEIMINGPGEVWLDRQGEVSPTGLRLDGHDIRLLIERILDPLGLRVDRSSPIVDARLPDGSRVNVILPPLAIDGPVVTIRRFASRPVPLEAFGTSAMVGVLTELMAARAAVLVIGGTGAGKTTLLSSLAALLDPNERVVTIEDTAELRFPGRHVVRLEARPPNSEGVGAVTIRTLVRNALRMRPDRIVIGEVRGAEALDLVLALNTGHRGSLATCHAGDPSGALQRLETLALLGSDDVPVSAIRAQLASAVDVIVEVDRVGSYRKVTQIVAVDEVAADGRATLRPLWAGDGRHAR